METHRQAVHEAIVDATASLVNKRGLAEVTMSGIAEEAGIGRATLYKYFSDVQEILVAWHERQVAAHLAQLAAVKAEPGSPDGRLEAVLEAFALISHQRHGSDLAALLHRGTHVARAHRQLGDLVRDLLKEGVAVGRIRDDVGPEELASYCLHALSAASSLPSKAAVRRLVTLTLAGLRPPRAL